MEKAKRILEKHKLRKTPFRIELLTLFINNSTKGLTNQYIESKLNDFDRVTLYRTLKAFEKTGIIHLAVDGSNESKYALCHEDCSEHSHIDDHAHFLCMDCGETYCMENVIQPQISLPAKYKLMNSHLALSGICEVCNDQKNIEFK